MVRYFFIFLLCVFISSCNNQVDDKGVNNVPPNDLVENIVSECKTLSSFDFIDSLEKNNFYKKDQEEKIITITNLIVTNYEINSDNTVILNCVAYSPERKEYIRQFNFHNDICSIVYKLKKEIIKNTKKYSNSYNFIVKLKKPKDVKQIYFYSGSETVKSTPYIPNFDENHKLNLDEFGKTLEFDEFIIRNIVTIKGVFKNISGIVCYNCNFSDCEFTITKTIPDIIDINEKTRDSVADNALSTK